VGAGLGWVGGWCVVRAVIFALLFCPQPKPHHTKPNTKPHHTGEITSRLAADTSTVSDSVSLNLNVFMRSATQAAVVLAFMVSASWRLTVVTFVLVPMVLLISKVRVRVWAAWFRCGMRPHLIF